MPAAVTAAAALPVLPGLWSLTPLGAVVVLLVLNWWMLNTGRLYTRGSHQEIVKLHEERHTAQEAILATKDGTIETLTEQNGVLAKSGAITDDFFQKVDAVLRRERDGDGPGELG